MSILYTYTELHTISFVAFVLRVRLLLLLAIGIALAERKITWWLMGRDMCKAYCKVRSDYSSVRYTQYTVEARPRKSRIHINFHTHRC